MFKGSLIKFIFGAVILLISYAFPFVLMPLGSYSNTSNSITTSYSFKWNNEYTSKVKTKNTSTEIEAYYKIDDKAIYWSLDKDVKVSDITKLGKIKNFYTLEIGNEKYQNNWALGFTIIGYVLTAWGLIGFIVPKKKK